MGQFRQGYFVPIHPEKYLGDVNKIIYRSSWELSMNKFLDNNDKVLRWSSEEITIPYIKPTDGKIHKYFPDYYIEYINVDGNIIREIVEIKPMDQVKKPSGRGKHAQYQQITYAINTAKWNAAKVWCEQNNINFRIITERQLYK